MTPQVKTLTCTIVDQFGRMDGAYAAIYGVSSSLQTTALATNTTDGYSVTNKVEGVSYNANYWYNHQTQIDGYRSRPLKVEEDGGLTDVLVVDLEHPEIQAILASNMAPLDCAVACAENDLTRRFI